jgi:hypothetical protein
MPSFFEACTVGAIGSVKAKPSPYIPLGSVKAVPSPYIPVGSVKAVPSPYIPLGSVKAVPSPFTPHPTSRFKLRSAITLTPISNSF